jgi:hypothetical protein
MKVVQRRGCNQWVAEQQLKKSLLAEIKNMEI